MVYGAGLACTANVCQRVRMACGKRKRKLSRQATPSTTATRPQRFGHGGYQVRISIAQHEDFHQNPAFITTMPPRPFPYGFRVGTDIIAHDRIRKLITRQPPKFKNARPVSQLDTFLRRTFTAREIVRFWQRNPGLNHRQHKLFRDPVKLDTVVLHLAGRCGCILRRSSRANVVIDGPQKKLPSKR